MFVKKADYNSSHRTLLLLFIIFPVFITLIFMLFPVYGQEIISQERSETLKNKTIGCILPLSGKYESIGKRALKGILTARNVVQSENDYEIVVKDYGESDLELRKAFEEVVIKDGASVVIGPFLSNSIKEVSDSAKSLMIPTVVFPLYKNVLLDNPYIINFSYPLEKQAQVLAGYAIEDMNMKSLGILYPKNDLGGLFKEAFVKAVTKHGGEITYIGLYDPKLLDISTEVGWIKSRHPRAIFIPDGATHSGKLIIRIRQENVLQDLIFLGPNTWNSQSFIKTVGPGAQGIIFTDFFFSGSQRWIEFSDKFRDYFHEEPGFLEYQAYEAASLILHILRTPIIKTDQIKERLLSLKDNPLFDIAQNINGGLDITPKPLVFILKNMEIVRVK